ncbi:MAG: hypothetical protein ACR2QO_09765 [Acidimicrobiales bacterium]
MDVVVVTPYGSFDRREIRGRPLRYLLTTLLREAGRPLSVRELVSLCAAEGVVFSGRASKIVSDALRWEIPWGRVVRLRRGIYRIAPMPRSTSHWIRVRVRALRGHLAELVTEAIEAGVGGPQFMPPMAT